MKTIALCAGCGAVAFLAMSYQMGLFEEPARPEGEPAQAAAEVSATARPSFPEDLAPACSGKPVAEARAYRAGSGPHPLAFLDGSGKLHAAWQQRLGEASLPNKCSCTTPKKPPPARGR
jgi:hypothetical protein